MLKFGLCRRLWVVTSQTLFTISKTEITLFQFRKIGNQPLSALEREIQIFFRQHNIPFVEGWTCFQCINIFQHNAPVNATLKRRAIASQSGHLTCYVNKTNGIFHCTDTNHEGVWDIYKRVYEFKGKKKLKEVADLVKQCSPDAADTTKETVSSLWYNKCKSVSELDDRHVPELYGLDVFSDELLANFKVKVLTDTKEIVFPWTQWSSQDGVSIRGVKVIHDRDYCNQEICSGSSKAYTTHPSSNYNALFGINSAMTKSSSIVLTANEFDALAINFASTKHSAVCLPDGISQLPLGVLPYLESFSRIIIWFGSGLLSWEAAQSFAKKLGRKRCKLVRSKMPVTTAYQAYKAGHNLDSIIQSAVSPIGNDVITFSDVEEDVRHELENREIFSGVPYQRFTNLNKKLKGHRRGELTVVTGPTGSGKTTLVSELSLDLAIQGVTTLWGSFEISNNRLLKCMIKQFARMQLEANMDQFSEVAKDFKKLPIYMMTYQGPQDVNSILETMHQATYAKDIQHVVIDNLQFMMGTQTRVDRFLFQDTIIEEFRKFATKQHVHVTVVIHPRKEDAHLPLQTSSIFGSAKATQEADNVLILQHHKTHDKSNYSKYLEIAKNRFDGEVGNTPLSFDRSTLCMSPAPSRNEDDARHIGIKTASVDDAAKKRLLINVKALTSSKTAVATDDGSVRELNIRATGPRAKSDAGVKTNNNEAKHWAAHWVDK